MQQSKYHSLVSGDGACAGCGEKTILHLLATMTEAYMRPIFHTKAARLLEKNLVLPAYDCCLKTSHYFNLLDARGAVSVNDRPRYIGRVRALARACAQGYLKSREAQGFPLKKKK